MKQAVWDCMKYSMAANVPVTFCSPGAAVMNHCVSRLKLQTLRDVLEQQRRDWCDRNTLQRVQKLFVHQTRTFLKTHFRAPSRTKENFFSKTEDKIFIPLQQYIFFNVLSVECVGKLTLTLLEKK